LKKSRGTDEILEKWTSKPGRGGRKNREWRGKQQDGWKAPTIAAGALRNLPEGRSAARNKEKEKYEESDMEEKAGGKQKT